MFALTETDLKQRFRFQFKQNNEWYKGLEEKTRQDPTFDVTKHEFKRIKMPSSRPDSFIKLDFNARKQYIKTVFKRIFRRLAIFIKMCRQNGMVLDTANLDVSQFVSNKFQNLQTKETHMNMLIEFLKMDPFFSSPQFNFIATRVESIKTMHFKMNKRI